MRFQEIAEEQLLVIEGEIKVVGQPTKTGTVLGTMALDGNILVTVRGIALFISFTDLGFGT